MTWTTPATPVALTAITVAFYATNIRDDLNHLRGLVPDPGAAGKVLGSSDAVTGSWLSALPAGFVDNQAIGDNAVDARTIAPDAVGPSEIAAGAVGPSELASGAAVSNIGYAPMSKLGDTASGQVAAFTSGSGIASLNAWNSVSGANGVGLQVINAGFTGFDLFVTHVLATFGVAISGTSATLSGALSAASATLTGALNAASAAITGNISVGVYGGGSTAAGTPSVLGLNVGAGGVAITGGPLSGVTGLFSSTVTAAGQFISTINNGVTPVFAIDAAQANVAVPNLKAARATLADSATTAGTATSANGVAALSVTDAGVATANKDGAAGTPSMRTLGTGAAQAAAGNHTHANAAQIASGTYSGNNGATQTITLSFAPKLVLIHKTDSGFAQWIIVDSGTTIPQINPGSSNGSVTAPTISGNTFIVTLASGTNASGTTNNYSYAAFG